MKKNLKTGIVSIVAGMSLLIALLSRPAHAQGLGDNDSESVPDAKKPPPPPPIQIAGTWNGTTQDNIKGPGTVNFTFTEKIAKTKATLKGTWMISYPDTAPFGVVNDFGSITGSVVGSTVALTLTPAKADDIGCKNIMQSTEATPQTITANFAACGHKGTIDIQPGPAPSTVFVNIGDDFFSPAKLTISAGQTVRWTNNGHEDHSVNANPGISKCKPASSESFDSPSFDAGHTFEHTFNTPGTFAYHCEIHGCPMSGTIIVK